MKWIKEISDSGGSSGTGSPKSSNGTTNLSERVRKFRERNIRECYVHPKDVKGFDRKKEHLWAKYDNFEFLLGEKEYKRFQRDYEIFCGGFLFYHDTHVKNRREDHFIYFEWGPLKNEKGSVSIYLWPPPVERVPKGDKPGESHYAGGTPLMAKNAALPPLPDEEESVDPPKPPPPPPPSML